MTPSRTSSAALPAGYAAPEGSLAAACLLLLLTEVGWGEGPDRGREAAKPIWLARRARRVVQLATWGGLK